VTVFAYDAAGRPPSSGDYPPSLAFASPDLAALADGRGRLFLLSTRSRHDKNQPQWDVFFQDEVGDPFLSPL
jgi:hypothetical protein